MLIGKVQSPDSINVILKEHIQQSETIGFTVKGSCMEPIIKDEDLVIIAAVNKFRAGDILVYFCPYQQCRFAHRYLGSLFTGREQKLLFKAGNAKAPDVLVHKDNVLGKVINVNASQLSISIKERIASKAVFAYWLMILCCKKAQRFLLSH